MVAWGSLVWLIVLTFAVGDDFVGFLVLVAVTRLVGFGFVFLDFCFCA